MSPVERSRVKNAPLVLSEDRTEFVDWATSQADGTLAAGWQASGRGLAADDLPGHVLKISGAKLVSLARRALNQTPDEVAVVAGVRVRDVVALEHGDEVAGETIARVAGALRLNAEVLAQLLGTTRILDRQLVEDATEFVAQLESAEPLLAREANALGKFRSAVQARGDMKGD